MDDDVRARLTTIEERLDGISELLKVLLTVVEGDEGLAARVDGLLNERNLDQDDRVFTSPGAKSELDLFKARLEVHRPVTISPPTG